MSVPLGHRIMSGGMTQRIGWGLEFTGLTSGAATMLSALHTTLDIPSKDGP